MAPRTDRTFRQASPPSDGDNAPLVSLRFNQLSHGASPWILNYRIHSKTQKVCWFGPFYVTFAIGGLLYWAKWEDAAIAMILVAVAWVVLSAPLMGWAIRRWGERFWIFDFSRNTQPTPLERRIADIGLVGPILLSLVLVIYGLFVKGFHEVLSILGSGFALAVFLAFFGSFIVPFLIIVFTGFKVRPVIDEGDGGDQEVSVLLQGSL